MKRIGRGIDRNESGLTLVEILASIVILALIFMSILMILSQTAKTNKTSEDIIDATYIAQTEMEKIYGASKERQSKMIDWFEGKYNKETPNKGWQIFKKKEDNYWIEIMVKTEELHRIVVKVYDEPDATKPKAQMENHLTWEEPDQNEAAP